MAERPSMDRGVHSAPPFDMDILPSRGEWPPASGSNAAQTAPWLSGFETTEGSPTGNPATGRKVSDFGSR